MQLLKQAWSSIGLPLLAGELQKSQLKDLKAIYGSAGVDRSWTTSFLLVLLLAYPIRVSYRTTCLAAALLVLHPFPLQWTFLLSQRLGPVWGPIASQTATTWPFILLLCSPLLHLKDRNGKWRLANTLIGASLATLSRSPWTSSSWWLNLDLHLGQSNAFGPFAVCPRHLTCRRSLIPPTDATCSDRCLAACDL
jgi:hypothetical protein